MSQIPNDLKYSETHEWIETVDSTITIGITDHAQELLGDVVFVELPQVGDTLNAGQEFGVIESVKAASDLYMPISGEVLEINHSLEDTPNTINESPYENGWLIKVKPTDESELASLKTAEEYQALTSEE